MIDLKNVKIVTFISNELKTARTMVALAIKRHERGQSSPTSSYSVLSENATGSRWIVRPYSSLERRNEM